MAHGLFTGATEALKSRETTMQLQLLVWPAIGIARFWRFFCSLRASLGGALAAEARVTSLQIAIVGFSAMLGLMALRMPIGLSMLVVGGIGYSMLNGVGPFLAYMKTNTYHQFANYTLSVIPLFILMGRWRSGRALRGHCSRLRSAASARRAGASPWR